jgi:deoxyuridine 5'-triphosphate nucleotidohydrolase
MTVDNYYFNSINNCEKAYILGLIIFNIKEISSDKIVVEVELNTEKMKDGNEMDLSYNMYIKLSDIDRNNYVYYKNIDNVIETLKKVGKVQCNNYNIIELTITSMYIIKDIFVKHLDLYLVHMKTYDLSVFMKTIYNTDRKLLNNVFKAYIEKNGKIVKDTLYIKFYNYKTLQQLITTYDIPYKILKEDYFIGAEEKDVYIIEYNKSNMIDFLGMIYANNGDAYDTCEACNSRDAIYVNNAIYNFTNNNSDEVPVLKIIKVDKNAIIPTKNNYSDAGLDLTIIKENRRLNSDTILYDTGIKLEIPNGYYVEIVSRSSISKSGYMLANNIGIIDQGYTGNLYIALRKINKDCEDLVLPYKCSQIIVKKQLYPKIIIKDNTKEEFKNQDTSRGNGGFGSTG